MREDKFAVLVRVKPMTEEDSTESCIQVRASSSAEDSSELKLMLPSSDKNGKEYLCSYDHIATENCGQLEIYRMVGTSTTAAVLRGFNATVFAYGQTGSGKTYTMYGGGDGSGERQLGFIPRYTSPNRIAIID